METPGEATVELYAAPESKASARAGEASNGGRTKNQAQADKQRADNGDVGAAEPKNIGNEITKVYTDKKSEVRKPNIMHIIHKRQYFNP